VFKWEQEEESAFQRLKEIMQEAPILGYPEPNQEFIVDTDASNSGAGAALSQCIDGQERVLSYYSKTFSPTQRNYCVTRRELLAVVMAVSHFRPYLYGQKFRLRTDHASLVWLYRLKEPSHQISRWLETLAEFDFNIEHRKGEKHGNADGLSRCAAYSQCARIQNTDGGLTHQEVLAELQPVQAVRIDQMHDMHELIEQQNLEATDIARVKAYIAINQEPPSTEIEASSYEFKMLVSIGTG
jgi:hypothetical protein